MDETTPAVEQGDAEIVQPEVPATEAPDPGEPEPVEETNAKPVEKPDGVQKRIDQLTRARHEAERKAAYWEGKAQGQKPDAGDARPQDAEPKPKQEAYQSYEEYIEAVTDWKLNARLTAERTRIQQESQQQTVARGFEAQVTLAREKHEDFDHVALGNHWQPTDALADAIRQSNDGAEQAYQLGAHFLEKPEEWARIASLSPTAQVMAIGRLQAKLEAKAAPPPAATVPSNAPAPITPVKASAPATAGLREDLSMEDWMRRRNAQLYKR